MNEWTVIPKAGIDSGDDDYFSVLCAFVQRTRNARRHEIVTLTTGFYSKKSIYLILSN